MVVQAGQVRVSGMKSRGMSGSIRPVYGAGHGEVSAASVVLLPYAPSSVATARGRLATDLREAGMMAAASGSLRVSVSDGGGPTRPRAERPSVSALGGRGLAIVEHLSSNWGIRSSGGRMTVWAVLPAPGAGAGAIK